MGNASWSGASRSSGHRATLNDCLIRMIHCNRHGAQKPGCDSTAEPQDIMPIMPIVPDQPKNRTQVLLQVRVVVHSVGSSLVRSCDGDPSEPSGEIWLTFALPPCFLGDGGQDQDHSPQGLCRAVGVSIIQAAKKRAGVDFIARRLVEFQFGFSATGGLSLLVGPWITGHWQSRSDSTSAAHWVCFFWVGSSASSLKDGSTDMACCSGLSAWWV